METQLLDAYQAGSIEKAATLLQQGEIIAFPTETVYGLGAMADNQAAIERLFKTKGRPQNNPLIVHVATVEQAKQQSKHWTDVAEKIAQHFWPGPITIIVKAKEQVLEVVRANLPSVALRMPSHPVAQQLIASCGPIVAPSANISGRPSPTEAGHVFEDFQGKIPLILDGGKSFHAIESTVVDAREDAPIILRPGAITPEMLQTVFQTVHISPAVLQKVQNNTAPSPGMLHRHYAPKGKATLFLPQQNIYRAIIQAYDHAKQQKQKTVIITSDADASYYGDRNLILCPTGNMAQGLFSALRKADEMQMEQILIQGNNTDKTWLAFLNRALFASGFETRGGKE